MSTYVSTYLVENREITLIVDGTKTLSDYVGQNVYVAIKTQTGVRDVLDLSQYQLRETNIDLTKTLSQIVGSLSDLQIAQYHTTKIPHLDPENDQFAKRMITYDALAAPDIDIAWTSISQPDVRNDIYQRSEMNDLVLSSKNRSFSNCLVSVNGMFHKTYLSNGEIYVKDGYSNVKNAKKLNVGVYDTTALGGHIIVPIDPHNIDASNETPFNGMTLTFPNMDFTGKTLFLVIDGYIHALDGTYRLINKNRLLLDMCQLDLINQFLQNPNTILYESELTQSVENELIRKSSAMPPTIIDKMNYYLSQVYPLEKHVSHQSDAISFESVDAPTTLEMIENFLINDYPSLSVNNSPGDYLMRFDWADNDISYPTVLDQIEYYLTNWPYTDITGEAMLVEYDWTSTYRTLNSAITTVSMTELTDPVFAYNTILSPHTFLIAINNPNVYIKRYPLARTAIPAQYAVRSKDTPRGLLLYNRNTTVPYVIYSEAMKRHHNLSINYEKTNRDVYKTGINLKAVPSPVYDQKNDQKYHVELLEFYAP